MLLAIQGPNIARAAFGFLGICGVLGFGGRFYHTSKDSPTIVMDERDKDIRQKAPLIGWAADWLFWGLICTVPWFAVAFRSGIKGMQEPWLPVIWLPLVYGATALLHVSAWSIAILVQYAKGVGENGA